MSARKKKAMSGAEADALWDKFKGAQPMLTCEEIDEIDEWWRYQLRNRRAALLMLTKPASWLIEQANNDRAFAIALEEVAHFANQQKEYYKALADMIQAAAVRCLMAMAERDDMQAIRAEGEKLRAQETNRTTIRRGHLELVYSRDGAPS